MAASLSQNLGSLLECPICMEEMDVPKGLPCQHTVCAKCLKGMLQQGTHKLKCPVCRQQVTLGPKGVDGLPNNPIIMNMKDLIKTKEAPMKDDPGVKDDISRKKAEFHEALAKLWNLEAKTRTNSEYVCTQIQQYSNKLMQTVHDASEAQLSNITETIKEIQQAVEITSDCKLDISKFQKTLQGLKEKLPSYIETEILEFSTSGQLIRHKVSSYLFKKFNKFPNEPTHIDVDFTVNDYLKDFTILPSGELIIIKQDYKIYKYDPDGRVIAVSPLVIDAANRVLYHEGMQKILIANRSQIIYALDPISLELVSKIKLALDNFHSWDMCSVGLMIAARSNEEDAIVLFQSDGSLHRKIYTKKYLQDWRVNKQGTVFATTVKGVLSFDLENVGSPQKMIIRFPETERYDNCIEIDANENLWIGHGPFLSVYQGSLGFSKILNINILNSIPGMYCPLDIHCSESCKIAIQDYESGFVTVFTVK